MKYTTRAFKRLLTDIIQQFEKDYPDQKLQNKASVYKTKLQQFILQTNTSALLRMQIEAEINKMPYYFSKIGYLVKDLRGLLRDNSAKDCMETDEYEKNELESTQQNPEQAKGFSEANMKEQLKKEQTKNKRYSIAVEQLTVEKDNLSSKLQDEIQKSQQYQTKLQELLSKIADFTQECGNATDDLKLVEELQQFNKELLKENIQLSEEKQTLLEKYKAVVTLNKKLKLRCDELESNYKSLADQFIQQTQLFNTQLAKTQEETRLLRQEFDARVKQLEMKQQTVPSSHRSHVRYFNQTKTVNVPAKQSKLGSAARESIQSILPEKLSL